MTVSCLPYVVDIHVYDKGFAYCLVRVRYCTMSRSFDVQVSAVPVASACVPMCTHVYPLLSVRYSLCSVCMVCWFYASRTQCACIMHGCCWAYVDTYPLTDIGCMVCRTVAMTRQTFKTGDALRRMSFSAKSSCSRSKSRSR